MTLRTRGIVLLVLMISLLYVNFNTFTPQKALELDDGWASQMGSLSFGENASDQVLSFQGEDPPAVESPPCDINYSYRRSQSKPRRRLLDLTLIRQMQHGQRVGSPQ